MKGSSVQFCNWFFYKVVSNSDLVKFSNSEVWCSGITTSACQCQHPTQVPVHFPVASLPIQISVYGSKRLLALGFRAAWFWLQGSLVLVMVVIWGVTQRMNGRLTCLCVLLLSSLPFSIKSGYQVKINIYFLNTLTHL